MRGALSSLNGGSIRADFPILDQKVNGHPLVYLDNAATSHKPRPVMEAMTRFYECDNSNVHRGIHALSHRATVAYEGARERAAEFLGAADSSEIIFTRGTTEAINLVANSWGGAFLREGDRVLLTEMEHHSNLVPWHLLATRLKLELVHVPITGDDGLLDLDRVDGLLDSGVKLFAFTHVSNTLGTVNPAAELCRRARERGIVTLVDAAQSAGHQPVDVREIGCDFLATSGHKMCGPTGIGILYGRRELLEVMPPYMGGGEMILKVGLSSSTFKKAHQRFEAGTPPFAEAVGLRAAMDYVDNVGRAAIFEHDRELARRTRAGLAELPGIRLLGTDDGAGIVSFHFDAIHAHDIVTFADQAGIAMRGGHHCTQPLMTRLGLDSTTRASFHFYNTREEVDRLVETMSRIHRFFTG